MFVQNSQGGGSLTDGDKFLGPLSTLYPSAIRPSSIVRCSFVATHLENILRLDMRRRRHGGWMPLRGNKFSKKNLGTSCRKKVVVNPVTHTRAAYMMRWEMLPREYPIMRGRFTMCVKQRKLEPAAVPTRVKR
jgi:hypothetical protein